MTYWLNALMWGAGGTGLGYILRDLRDALATRPGEKMDNSASPDLTAGKPPPRRHALSGRHLQSQIVAVLILIAVVVSVILDANASSNQAALSRQQLAQAAALHKLSACQSSLNEQFLAALKGRSAANDEAQDALTKLIGTIPTSVAAGKNFAAAFHAALVNYDQTIARINAARPKLPPLPSQVCH